MPKKETLQAADVIALLREIAQRMKLRGGNRFRARPYETAADRLGTITRPLAEVIAAGELTSIAGIGSAIAGVIERLYTTGSHPTLEKLRKEIPQGVLHMLSILGLRSDQILTRYQQTGISNAETLQKAIDSGELEGKKGFTPAFKQKVLQGLKIRREVARKYHIHRATALLEEAKTNLGTTHPNLRNITIAGDVRRQCELVEDLSLVAISDKPRRAKPVLGDIRLHLCREDNFGNTLLWATGSAAHIQALVAMAKKKKLTLTPDALTRGRTVIASKTEEEVYQALGLAFIPPEWREGHGEIEQASKNALSQLVTREAIQGILHAHTIRSDGANTLEEMAEAARQRGFSYFIIASIHSRFTMDRAMQTARIIRAVQHPYTTILGHMTGRQLLRRPGYDVDVKAVLKACAEFRVAVEINAHPWRLDVDWRWHQMAMKFGCMMSINPDAHSTDELDNVKWGVAMARKGGIPPERVINCMSAPQFTRFISGKKTLAAP